MFQFRGLNSQAVYHIFQITNKGSNLSLMLNHTTSSMWVNQTRFSNGNIS